jgi:plastocyanin domain-containing protein
LGLIVGLGPAAVVVEALETEGVQEARVRVTADGFAPSRVLLRRDVPARIVFLRADDENCADEVVVPDANIAVDLPVGTPVVVGFTPTKDGDLAFTCGMRMYRGTLRVVGP